MADTEINIKLNGLAEIKKQLRELKSELANATDPEEMARLSEQAGVLSDRLKDANEKVAVFAAGSPFEQTSNALGLMGSQLASLDFEGAAESSKLFAQAAKGINGDVIAKSLKSLGTVVVQVGRAFMSVGLSLLTNPIFLIAAAIVAIVAAIALLLNKLGILKPILKAIGKAFEFVMNIINGMIAAFKMLTDWLGLTAHASEESAERQQKAAEKSAEAREKELERTTKVFDKKIRLAQIEGKDTKALERQKQQAILETEKARYKELISALEFAKRKGDVDEEEIKRLMEKAKTARTNAQNARDEIQYINAQEVADAKKKNEEIKKAEAEAYKDRVAKAKQYAEDRKNAERQIRDLELAAMEEGKNKELAMLDEKYKRLIEDTQKNEKLLADEKKRLIQLYSEEQFEETKDIEQRYTDELSASVLAATNARNQRLAEEEAAFIQRTEEERAKQKEKRQKDRDEDVEREKAYKEARLNLGSELVKGLQGLDALLQQAGVKTAGLQKTIALVQIATDTAKAISATIAGATAAAAMQGPAGPFLLAGYIASGIGTVLGAVASAWAALKKAPPVGGAVSGSAPTASSATTQAMTPSVNLFGQNNNANNVSSPKDVESNQNMVVKAVVVESDITNTQNKIQKMQENATL